MPQAKNGFSPRTTPAERRADLDLKRRITRLDGVLATGAAIPDPAGGGTVDAEARAAIVALLDFLRDRGILEP